MAGKNKRKRNNKKNALKKANLSDSAQEIMEGTGGEDVDASTEDDQRSPKRSNEDDSDVEDQPKIKKKKKQIVPGDTAGNKGKSIRQMKKEKHAQRLAATEAASKDQLKSQCISYLSQWKHDKQNWKFMKIKQVWLFKNKFSSDLVPDSSWKTLLEYFESAQGNIRNLLLEDANKVIKQMDEWTESLKDKKQELKNSEGEKSETEETDDKKEPEITKPNDTAYKRARDLIQCLN